MTEELIELLTTLEKYLKYKSVDGALARQPLRKKLEEQYVAFRDKHITSK